jgi:hypothetical protein
MFTDILDGLEVLEEDDLHIMDGEDDSEYFELELEENTLMYHDDFHRDMWNDFDEINPDDLPC